MAQDRFTIAFDKNETEQELFKWIKEKSVILGPSKFVKQLLYEKMLEEKQNKNI
jgi:hypothetical protein